jgi:hypothetical protein
MRLCRLVALAAGLYVSLFAYARASVTHSSSFQAVKTAEAPAHDASLQDPVWNHALKADGFFNSSERRPASLPTTAYFLYDDRNVYVAFHCIQNGVPITATQHLDNAGIATDDHVTLWLDTSGNGSRTYAFSVSPRGVHDEQSSENARYAPSWESTAIVSPNGDYNALMIIPLANLRAQHTLVQNWRINFVRYIAARNDEYTWAYESTLSDVSVPQYWPTISGIRVASRATRPRARADAYVLESAGSQRNIFQNGIGRFQPMNPRLLGIDATYPFTDTLAFVGTLNPDFSNVEQDQLTIAPQEFQRFFTEYRPFFAEGAGFINSLPQMGIFGPANELFYTPSIGVFNRGLKVEGTAGRTSIGALNAVGPGLNDSAFGYAYQQPNNTLTLAAEGVLARHPGVNDDTIGFGVGHTNAHSGVIALASVASESGSLVTDSSASRSLNAGGGIQNNHFLLYGGYADIGPQYSPVDGFTQINDIRGLVSLLQYHQSGSTSSPIKRYTLMSVLDRYFDRNGQVHQADVAAIIDMDFKNLLTVHAFAGPSELRFYDTGYPDYTGGQTLWFNRRMIGLGYREDSPSPTTASYAWGPFAGYFVQQWNSAASRSFGVYSVSAEYDANIEHAVPGGPAVDSQWLRRFSLVRSFGRNASLAIGVRSINGRGGLADPGTNLSFSYQQRFANEDRLYVVYGTPAAAQTLHRFIIKYVFHAGGESGT